MRVMIFIDNSNFFNSILNLKKDRNQDRVIDYHKLNKFVLNYLSKNPQYERQTLFHMRTYYYDGEYTDTLLNKIKQHLNSITLIPENGEEIHKIKERLEKVTRRMKAQKREMDRCKNFYFFETRLKPLQYGKKQGAFQKGVDVQLAVDLVSNAYLNNYDIAVLFSGDIDLLESLKLIKSLGKHIIIFSHYSNIAKEMLKESDLFVDFQRLDNDILDKFSHIFEKHD